MVRHDFLFIAGEPALDFLNTEIVRDGEPVDLLDAPESVPAWLAEGGLVSSARTVAASAETLAAVKRLRAAVREVAGAMADGRAPRQAAVAAIDQELRRGRGTLTFRGKGGRFSVEFEAGEPPEASFLLARTAAEFFARAEPARIHRCEGTNCVLFFYDVTRSGTRRWCSMAGCGNRMKAALHYQRKKDGA
jgi:predicted RNA-binding Zn ribbon-like protein